MKKTRHLLPTLLLGALALLGSQAPANAAQFCVNSAASLQTALTTAADNGVDDEVRIVRGTYVGNFVYDSMQANKLSVLGGYTAGCAGRVLDPVNTVLDGKQTGSVLELWAQEDTANFLVEGLTLRMGKPGSSNGYGLEVETDGVVTVNRNKIENIAGEFSGGATIQATTATLTNNSITGNTGLFSGGAYIQATTATLTNNSITGNTGQPGSGGAYIQATTATLTNNSITGNTGQSGSGGAYIMCSDFFGCTATLTNNSISGNTASGAGGAYIDVYYGTATLTNNTLVGNVGMSGGGLWLSAGRTETTDKAILYNNLFWANRATGIGAAADLWIDNDGDRDRLPTPVTLLANNFDRSAAGFKITLPITIPTSNLNKINPLFVNQAGGNLRLTAGSPMINAGYPKTPNLPATDLGGGPRVLGAAVDIGAYEFNNGSSGKPDFVVTSLVLTPTSPFATATFSVKITLKNQGTRAGKPGTLQLWTNNPNQANCGAVGNQSASWTTDLAPGASLTMNMTGLAAGPAGTKTLRAFIDSQCATAESSDTNNQLTQAYTVKPPAPDFGITSIVLTPTSPKANGTFKAVVTVKNFGPVAGNGGYLDVWNNLAGKPGCGVDGTAWASVGPLAANTSKAFTFTGLRSGAAGAKTFRAFVDSNCQSAESSETNNQAVKGYSVVP